VDTLQACNRKDVARNIGSENERGRVRRQVSELPFSVMIAVSKKNVTASDH
jgi:hypothetical protein